MTVAVELPAGGTEQEQEPLLSTLHRTPRAVTSDPLVGSGELGNLEALLRELAPVALDELAVRAGMEPTAVVSLLDRHPCAFRGGDGRWRILARLPYEFVPPAFTAVDIAAPSGTVIVACPDCGVRHEITAGRARKVRSGERTARCSTCTPGRSPAPWLLDRPPLSERDMEALGGWWLSRFSDDEIARLAQSLFAQGDAANVARWRTQLS